MRTYTEFTALASCKFVIREKNKYVGKDARLPNSYLVGYFLAKLWQRNFKSEGSVFTESILSEKMGLAGVLGLKADALQEQLNQSAGGYPSLSSLGWSFPPTFYETELVRIAQQP
ncbi:hypothetical protein [Nostoc sp.]|uniref:hypothetical protein n=1 Tax=Nostoc sp. TaxID=1180 RepID=UPI002FFBD6A0